MDELSAWGRATPLPSKETHTDLPYLGQNAFALKIWEAIMAAYVRRDSLPRELRLPYVVDSRVEPGTCIRYWRERDPSEGTIMEAVCSARTSEGCTVRVTIRNGLENALCASSRSVCFHIDRSPIERPYTRAVFAYDPKGNDEDTTPVFSQGYEPELPLGSSPHGGETRLIL